MLTAESNTAVTLTEKEWRMAVESGTRWHNEFVRRGVEVAGSRRIGRVAWA